MDAGAPQRHRRVSVLSRNVQYSGGHTGAKLVSMTSLMPDHEMAEIVQRALQEDVGRGDITSQACVAEDAKGAANFIARQAMVISGWPVVKQVFKQIDPKIKIETELRDGEVVNAGTVLGSIKGSARSILLGERVALNFMQRMSGIATLTAKFVSALPAGSQTKIMDTRKTTPGLRVVERYAVRCGGGYNHRADLGAAILIKDNHVAAAGGVTQAIEAVRLSNHGAVECEVDSIEQLQEALQANADIILLDNFSDDLVERALAKVQKRALVEVSGGVTVDRVSRLAQLGVDRISIGALTHSAPAADISLEWQ
jgi:nicotinate-nucleotide pyrophosphorylase (carboxylating)